MAWLSTEFYYYAGSAPCRAVWMTLKALDVDVEEKEVDLLKAENKRPWFIRMNFCTCVPTFNDQSFVLWESRAIMMYLCNKYCTPETQHLYPKAPEERALVDRLLFFDMGTLNYAIKEYFKPRVYQGLPPDPERENMLKQSLDYLDQFVEKSENGYLTSDAVSIADLAILASISELDAMDYSYRCYGEVAKWSDKLKACLPYYKKCCNEGVKMTRARVKQMEDDVKKAAEKERKPSVPKK